MRVLITGGYGFIGAWIIRNLLADGHTVFVYDLKEDNRRLRQILPESEVRKVAFVQGDVTNLDALTAALKSNAITHVIHLAGLQVPTCRANPMLGATVNVPAVPGQLDYTVHVTVPGVGPGRLCQWHAPAKTALRPQCLPEAPATRCPW